MLEFQTPYFILLGIFLPILFFYIKNHKKNEQEFVIPIVSANIDKNSKKIYFVYFSFFLRSIIVVMLIISLMQPVITVKNKDTYVEGIDIAICLDVSQSMLEEIDGFMQKTRSVKNRLEATKVAAIEFVKKRENDRIALIAFAGESIAMNPLSLQHSSVIENISKLRTNRLADGTAIGCGIASAVSRLKLSKNKTKIIILLTDGFNNINEITPEEAVDAAKFYNIKIYSIFIGKRKYMKDNNQEAVESTQMLETISQETNGNYFQASSLKDIEKVYTEIDKLEKNEHNVTIENKEIYLTYYILLVSVLLLIIEMFIRVSILKMM
jgi:Ca-activated chloride channel family protein